MSLEEITFADLDPASIESGIVTAYENIAQTTLYPGDPVRLFLESLAYVLTLQNNLINTAGRQNLLAYASNGHLDHLGQLVGTARLSASRAVVMQRFSLSAPLGFAVIVPQGTRVATADGKLIFTTDTDVVIAAGATSAEVQATAAQAGAQANGLVAGQISVLVDPVAYVSKTENISASLLGMDVESDARYRERIQLAPEAYSNAGSTGAYRYHALTAHQSIAEVSISCPVPGTVDVRPVCAGGELPSAEVLAAVRAALCADTVRPLTDTVIVAAPDAHTYALHVRWSLAKGQSALASSIAATVAAALESYRLWQRSAPGRDINPTRLISLLEQAGARRVEVISPAYATLTETEIARETSVTCEYLGVEDE